MRKRVTALMLAAVMALSLFGCGAAAESEATEESTEALAQEQEDSGETEAADETTKEVWGGQTGEVCGDENGEYTIGVIIHTTTDYLCAKLKSYTDYLGKEYSVKFSYYIIENFADETYLAGIENLCAQGVDGIITTNFSGTAVLQGLKICEDNGVYMGVGWSQIDEQIKDQVYASDYFVGGAYESEVQAGKDIIESLISAGCTNIAPIGYEPGITCHDRRWQGMMEAFEEHPEINKAGEYRGLEFTKAVEDYLASDETIDGIAITLLGIEYCMEPIKSAGREGKVKIAFVDLSENCGEYLESGDVVCAIGGQYVDVVFPFLFMYNALNGTPLEKAEVPVNFITCKSAEEFENYANYLHADGVYCWTAEELNEVIVKYNPDATADMLVEMGANYSAEDTMARHGVN
ncbi:substrate-binding domain-containing protein [Lachnospiraceae bacterium 38-10]